MHSLLNFECLQTQTATHFPARVFRTDALSSILARGSRLRSSVRRFFISSGTNGENGLLSVLDKRLCVLFRIERLMAGTGYLVDLSFRSLLATNPSQYSGTASEHSMSHILPACVYPWNPAVGNGVIMNTVTSWRWLIRFRLDVLPGCIDARLSHVVLSAFERAEPLVL